MKLKELFFIVLCTLPLFSIAAEKQIEINVNCWRERGMRSIPSIPVLTHDGNILSIHSDVPLENLQIRVEDAFGDVVYAGNVSLVAGQKYSFVLEDLPIGSYVITLSCGGKTLWGNFEFES